MTQPADLYVHGTSPVEQERLSWLNRYLNEPELALMKLRPGDRVLDLGSGLGQFSRALARRGCAVVGVERDPQQLAEARRQAAQDGEAGLVEFRQGDVLELPLRPEEWGGFDAVHARFLLEHLRRPEMVVQAMVRAARPGGRLYLADDDHADFHLWPEAPEVQELWDAFARGYRRHGQDPFIGRKLAALLHQAGAQPARNSLVFFGGCAGSPEWPAVLENFAGALERARDWILGDPAMDEERYAAATAVFRAWGQRPDAVLWYPMYWVEGRKP